MESNYHQVPRDLPNTDEPAQQDARESPPISPLLLDDRNRQPTEQVPPLQPLASFESRRNDGIAPYQPTGRKGFSWYDFSNDWWVFEVLAWLLSAVFWIGVVVTLDSYDDELLSSWKHGITLNTLVSLAATVSRAALVFPIACCIGQLKWLWLSEKQRALLDVEIFDEASRSAWGAAMFLFKRPTAILASVASLLAILVVATGTIAQQAITYPSLTTTVGDVSLPWSQYYTPSLTRESRGLPRLSTSTIGPVYRGILYNGNDSTTVLGTQATCPTGNCTWSDPYTTLAMCSTCSDLSDKLTFHNDSNYETYTLPNGLSAQTYWPGPILNETFVMKGGLDLLTLNAYYTSVLNISAIQQRDKAIECALYFCVNEYNATVINGRLEEELLWTSPFTRNPNETSSDTRPWRWQASEITNIPNPLLNLTAPPHSTERPPFFIDASSYIVLAGFLNTTLSGTVSTNSDEISSGTEYDSDIMQYLALEGIDGLPTVFENLATSFTTYIRNPERLPPGFERTTAQGRSTSTDTYIQVEWGYLVPTFLVEIGVAVLLALTVAMSARKRSGRRGVGVWKNSALALVGAVVGGLQEGKLARNASDQGVDTDDEGIELRARDREEGQEGSSRRDGSGPLQGLSLGKSLDRMEHIAGGIEVSLVRRGRGRWVLQG